MSDVPPELITVIFSRLPVKSLLRFRCVSKPFRALIDSPNFIKSHHNQSLKSNSHQTLITLNLNTQIYSTVFDSLDKPTLLSQLATLVLGSCNGLLCLLYNNDVFLFNPSTRERKKLPGVETRVFPNHSCLGGCDNVVYGLGYDCVTDDYKVVRITQCVKELESEFMVYSLKSNSWRRIKDFPYIFTCKGVQNVFVNGALHWLVNLKSVLEDFVTMNLPGVIVDSYVVSFDLATEEYCLVPLPEFQDKNFLMKVGELGGKLCVHCNYYMDHIDIWVMSCYGVKESWSKLLTVAQSVDIPKFAFVHANAYSLDGERVLLEQEGGKLFWYDLKLKRVKRIRIPGLPKFFLAHMCMGSLVKLSNGARTDAARDKTLKKNQKAMGRRDDFLSKGFKLVL